MGGYTYLMGVKKGKNKVKKYTFWQNIFLKGTKMDAVIKK